MRNAAGSINLVSVLEVCVDLNEYQPSSSATSGLSTLVYCFPVPPYTHSYLCHPALRLCFLPCGNHLPCTWENSSLSIRSHWYKLFSRKIHLWTREGPSMGVKYAALIFSLLYPQIPGNHSKQIFVHVISLGDAFAEDTDLASLATPCFPSASETTVRCLELPGLSHETTIHAY